MELYCEDRFINFPPEVEFELNGVDAGEYLGSSPCKNPIGTPPDTSDREWDVLNQEIFNIIQDMSIEPERLGDLAAYQPVRQFEKNFATYKGQQRRDEMQLIQQFQQEPYPDQDFQAMQQFGEPFQDTEDFLCQMLEQQLNMNPRRLKKLKDPKKYCVFCKNNNEEPLKYMSHSVKDAFGNVTCPRLYKYVCPICNRTGAEAHTTKYCPDRPIVTMELAERLQKRRTTTRRNIGYYV